MTFEDVFNEQSKYCLHRFRELMNDCKNKTRTIKVAIEGAGDVFENYYWEHLKKYRAEKQAKFWITDVKKPRIYKQIKRDFMNKRIIEDFMVYNNISPDIVFILVPDRIHLATVERWIGEEEWIGRANTIFIEKPYDRYLEDAIQFQKFFFESGNKRSIIFCFDHYLVKIHDFIENKKQVLDIIGGSINNITFNMLEPGPIKKSRAESVVKGMIFDMFCHQLALISTVLNIETLSYIKVQGAKYENSPIGDNETFASLDFILSDHELEKTITVSGHIGKGVGKEEQKYMILEGSSGFIIFDFIGKKILISVNGKQPEEKFIIRDAYNFFIETLFNGEYMKRPVGALSHKNSLLILRKLESAREIIQEQIRKKPLVTYEVGTKLEKIMDKIRKSEE